MKYITTDKHPELKEGRIIDAEYSAYFVVDKNRPFITDIEKGYIKEVQEKEFTKDDMIELIRFDFNSPKWDPKEVLMEFLNQRK